MRRMLLPFVVLGSFAFAVVAQLADDAWEILYDGQAKIALKDAHFTAGTRHLSWLATDEKPPKAKAKVPARPEYLEFREDKTPMYKDDIVTYIPVASLLRLEYDHDKKLVRAAVKQAGDKDLTLVGPTKFANINKFSLEGTAVMKADLGVEGALQFQDGLMKTPFRALIHHAAKPAAAPTGGGAVVIAQDKAKTEHKVQGLMPLYKVGAGQKLASVLMFETVGQIDVAKIAVLRQNPPAEKKQAISHVYEVTQIDGAKRKLTLLENTQLDGNQKAVLVGLVGRVPAGYKLFPPHTIAEVRFAVKSE